MAETVETLVVDRFLGFDPRIPKGACNAARLPKEGTLKYCSGVEVAPDGSLRLSRDQFRIPGPAGVTITSLYEVAFESYNQLLAFGSDSNMYVLGNLDWASATPTQWDYGYELFNNTSYSWSTGIALGQDGLYSAAEMVNHLYIPRPGGSMKRWDGVTLEDVGFAAPETACSVVGSDEIIDVTSLYTEVDPGDAITINTSEKAVSWDTLNSSQPSYVYRDLEADAIGDFDYRWRLNVDFVNGRLNLVSVANELSGTDWRAFRNIRVWISTHDGALRVNLETVSSTGAFKLSHLTEFAFDQDYYLRFYRKGLEIAVEIYTDSGYSGSARRIVLTDWTRDYFRYLYLLATWNYNAGAKSSATIRDVDLTSHSSTSTRPGCLPAGTYGYFYTYANDEWESMPSPIVRYQQTTDNQHHDLAGIAAPTDDRVTKVKIYRAYTPEIGGETVVPDDLHAGEIDYAASAEVGLGLFQYVDSVDLGTSFDGTYEDNVPGSSLGEAMPYDYALPPWAKELVFHNERLFATRITKTSASYPTTYTTDLRNYLYYTPLSAPAYWPQDYVFKVGDAAPIVGLHSWRDYLLIFKTNGTWVLSGWDDETFTLERLDDNGMCAYHAVASSHAGVMWWSAKGLMFFDGARVQTMVPSFDTALTPPKFSDGEKSNWIVFHRGRYYILSDGNLYWYEVETDTWGAEESGTISGGLRAVNLGENQYHLLCQREWAPKGGSEITLVHTGRTWEDYASAGTSASDYHAPVDIRFRPLIAGPEEEIELLQVWVDGNWTDDGVEGHHLSLMVSNDAETWTTVGDLSHIYESTVARANLVRETCVGNPLYVRFSGTYAADFRLYLVRFHYVRRQRRAGIAV